MVFFLPPAPPRGDFQCFHWSLKSGRVCHWPLKSVKSGTNQQILASIFDIPQFNSLNIRELASFPPLESIPRVAVHWKEVALYWQALRIF